MLQNQLCLSSILLYCLGTTGLSEDAQVRAAGGAQEESPDCGFILGYTAVKISGMTEMNGNILFLIEW